EYCKWFLLYGIGEYGLSEKCLPENLLSRLIQSGGLVHESAQGISSAQRRAASLHKGTASSCQHFKG
ncbi:MAG TPA: hypothetical protein PLK99_10110, partial [Burkholderiales bacterium]|nr:hypothetical protein [Burkholderiales bacterium]